MFGTIKADFLCTMIQNIKLSRWASEILNKQTLGRTDVNLIKAQTDLLSKRNWNLVRNVIIIVVVDVISTTQEINN